MASLSLKCKIESDEFCRNQTPVSTNIYGKGFHTGVHHRITTLEKNRVESCLVMFFATERLPTS